MNIVMAVALIVLTVMSRFLETTINFTPVLAIALFSGSYFLRGSHRFLVPLAGMLMADAYFGFYPGIEWTYSAIALAVILQPGLRPSVVRLGVRSTLAALGFFVISNFGVWWTSDLYPVALYPKTAAGLIDCYIMGLPFFKNTLISVWLFSVLFFGIHYLVTQAQGKPAPAYGRQKR